MPYDLGHDPRKVCLGCLKGRGLALLVEVPHLSTGPVDDILALPCDEVPLSPLNNNVLINHEGMAQHELLHEELHILITAPKHEPEEEKLPACSLFKTPVDRIGKQVKEVLRLKHISRIRGCEEKQSNGTSALWHLVCDFHTQFLTFYWLGNFYFR